MRKQKNNGNNITVTVKHFMDWESDLFGYGYGTGQWHILPKLHEFLSLVPDDTCYDYEVLEAALGGAVTWLLINFLCRADILSYGTSPRHGWLTEQGRALKSFCMAHTSNELYGFVTSRSHMDEDICYPGRCYCGGTYEEGRKCTNPLWYYPKVPQ